MKQIDFDKFERAGNKFMAYTMRYGGYIIGSLETINGILISSFMTHHLLTQPIEDQKMTAAIVVAIGLGSIADGVYSLAKGERPLHLVFSGLEKVTKHIGLDEFFPKYSTLMKQANSSVPIQSTK